MKWYGINIGEQDAQTRSYTVTQAIPILIQREDGTYTLQKVALEIVRAKRLGTQLKN